VGALNLCNGMCKAKAPPEATKSLLLKYQPVIRNCSRQRMPRLTSLDCLALRLSNGAGIEGAVRRARLHANALATSHALVVHGASASAPRISTCLILTMTSRRASQRRRQRRQKNGAASVDVPASGPKLNPVEQSLGGRATFIRESRFRQPNLYPANAS
jgi:hypothetical protein